VRPAQQFFSLSALLILLTAVTVSAVAKEDRAVRLPSEMEACPICVQPLGLDAMEGPCRHVFCEDCIVSFLDTENRCPTCNAVLDFEDLSHAPVSASVDLVRKWECFVDSRCGSL